jgi:high potential iron-sulfur protein
MQHFLTRRGILIVCMGFVSRADGAAMQKRSKVEVAYRGRPAGIASCASCSFFQAPKSCAVVEGVVSRNGWCKLYAPVD